MNITNKISQTMPLQFDTVFSPFRAEEFDSALDFLEKKGFTGVEIAVARPKDVNAAILIEKLKAHNLSATTISTGQAYAIDGKCLSSFDADVRRASAEVVKAHVDLSAKIGRPPVTIGLLRGKLESGDKGGLLENLREALNLCAEYARERGVVLQIEPICKEETVLLNTVRETLEFIESLANPQNVGLLYDTYHSNIEDGDLPAAIRLAADKITNVHLADSHRGLPGCGNIDFHAVFSALRSVGYVGALALETLVIPNREFVNEHCFKSIEKLIDE